MGKKNLKGAYNDFLDGEKLRDNAQVWSSLAGPSPGDVSPPPTRREDRAKGKAAGKQPNKKPQLTHFLCLPLVNPESRPQLEKALGEFTEEMEKEGLVPLKAIRPVGTLHLTLGVMALQAQALEDVGKCLEDLDLEKLLRKSGPSPTEDTAALAIDLKALIPMQPQQKISILYAEPVDPSARLYAFASALRNHFADRGFLVHDARPLKLHATIVNTIYAKPRGRTPWKRAPQTLVGQRLDAPDALRDLPDGEDEAVEPHERSEGHGPNAKSQIRFDARGLVERYAEFVWAEGVRVDRVQVCKMGAKKILDEEGEVVAEEYEEVFGKGILG